MALTFNSNNIKTILKNKFFFFRLKSIFRIVNLLEKLLKFNPLVICISIQKQTQTMSSATEIAVAFADSQLEYEWLVPCNWFELCAGFMLLLQNKIEKPAVIIVKVINKVMK